MELWAHDVQLACDVFRPVYEATNHVDGYVESRAAAPAGARRRGHDRAAREVRKRVDRPNLALRDPLHAQSFVAIEQCVFDGVNVNATVIFSPKTYEQVIKAYCRGLERRVAAGLSVDLDVVRIRLPEPV